MLEDELRRELEAEDFVAEGFAAGGAAGAEGGVPKSDEVAAELGKTPGVLGAELGVGLELDPGLPLIAATLAAACLH